MRWQNTLHFTRLQAVRNGRPVAGPASSAGLIGRKELPSSPPHPRYNLERKKIEHAKAGAKLAGGEGSDFPRLAYGDCSKCLSSSLMSEDVANEMMERRASAEKGGRIAAVRRHPCSRAHS